MLTRARGSDQAAFLVSVYVTVKAFPGFANLSVKAH